MAAPEYLALRDKVDAFARSVQARRSDAMRCRAGCDGCCHVRLELSDVEADALREAIAALDERTRAELRRDATVRRGARCVLLDDAGRCRAYGARPLVCRTQGLPLRYPADTVPIDALRARAEDGADVTWCPLNFEAAGPRPDDVLDAERVDVILAVVNRRYAAEPLRRTAIEAIVLEAG